MRGGDKRGSDKRGGDYHKICIEKKIMTRSHKEEIGEP